MGTLKQSTVACEEQPRSRVWLLAAIMVIAFVLAWTIGTHAMPAASATVSEERLAAPEPFQSPPGPFLSPLYLPLISRQVAIQPHRVHLPVVLR